MEERHVPLSTVAGRLGVSERTVRRWIKAGKLKATRPGRDYRIPESALRELIEEGEVSPKESGRSAPEPSLFNGLEDAAQAEALQEALAVLFQGLARRGQAIVEQSLREGPSEALSKEVEEYYKEVVALHRIKGGRDIFGRDSDELAEAEAAYQEVEARIQAMTQQDVEATDEERSHFRKFREKRKNQRREEPKADVS
jgi:excisionase family DNA binding protein